MLCTTQDSFTGDTVSNLHTFTAGHFCLAHESHGAPSGMNVWQHALHTLHVYWQRRWWDELAFLTNTRIARPPVQNERLTAVRANVGGLFSGLLALTTCGRATCCVAAGLVRVGTGRVWEADGVRRVTCILHHWRRWRRGARAAGCQSMWHKLWRNRSTIGPAPAATDAVIG